jgi:hypothetical protein
MMPTKWTKTPPTEPGYYWAIWCKNDIKEPEVVYFFEDLSVMTLIFIIERKKQTFHDANDFIWWPVPIPTPGKVSSNA